MAAVPQPTNKDQTLITDLKVIQTALGTSHINVTYNPATGDIKAYQYNTIAGVNGVNTEIYKNGIWNPPAANNLTAQDRNSLHDQIVQKFNSIKKSNPNGVIPAFIKNNTPSQDSSINGTRPTESGSGGITATLGQVANDALSPLIAIDKIAAEYASTPGDGILKTLGKNGFLKYPSNILELKQDVLIIKQFRYSPPRKSIFGPITNGNTENGNTENNNTNQYNILQSGIQRESALQGSALTTVILPIPNNLQDSNNVGWGPDNMNALTAAATNSILTKGSNSLISAIAGGTLSALFGGSAGDGAKLGLQLQLYQQLLSQATAGNEGNALLGTAIASKVLNMAGFEVSPESILANRAGLVPNSNLELLFNAPTLREFRFDYRMSPRSEDEATMVKQIIRSFKQGMAPRKKSSSAGSASYFLATPNVFKLTYRSEGIDNIEGLNKFKICALTGFSVNYTPDGQWSAYDGGQPVSYMVSMSFNELEPIYENDYQPENKDNSNKFYGRDLEPVSINDVGY